MITFMFAISASAVDLNDVVENLTESSDYQNVKNEAAPTICNIINSLLGADKVSPNELDWSKAYKIYVTDQDIFSLQSFSKKMIMDSLDYYIWCYPTQIEGKNIRVTISKAAMPEYSLVEQGVINGEEYAELVDRADTWVAPEGEIDTLKTNENIEKWLHDSGINETDDIILLGGNPKIRSLIAITFENGKADKLIPLAPNPIDLSIGTNEAAFSEDSDVLQVGHAYNFSDMAQLLSNIPLAANETGGVGGTAENIEVDGFVAITLISVLALVGGVLFYFRKKQH